MHLAAAAVADLGVQPELMYLGNLRSPIDFLKAPGRVRERARGFDLVHAQYGSATALVTANSARPGVLSIRGSDWTPEGGARFGAKIHGPAATWMTRRAIPNYARVISVSRRMAVEIEASFPRVPVDVIPDPVDLAKFRPMPAAQSREALGLRPDARYVLFTSVHRDAPNKRVGLAEEAVEVARATIPELELLVASGYSHDQMPLVVSSADVAICTSIAEGWPNSMKEALACNVPFVATDVSDLRDIAKVDQRCRVVAATPEALGKALVDVLQSKVSSSVRQYVEPMSMSSFACQLIEAYERTLAQ